jgi:hypothetical protein
MNKFNEIKPIHVFLVIALFFFLNSFDAIYSLHVINKYGVSEQNNLVASMMKDGSFLFMKIGIPLIMGLLIFNQIKKLNKKHLIIAFAVGKLGILFYVMINTLNIMFIYHYFGGI